MVPAEFDADAYLLARRLVLGSSAEGGSGDAAPGLRGHLGAGDFTVRGEIILPETPSTTNLALSRADLQADLHTLDLNLPGLVTAKLNGQLLLGNDPETGVIQLSTPRGHPLVLSKGQLGVPESVPAAASTAWALPVTPELDLHLVTGPDLKFNYSSAYASIHTGIKDGALEVTGALSDAGSRVHGQVSANGGTLDFPNGHLELSSGRVRGGQGRGPAADGADRGRGGLGQVGDYEVALSPRGQIYPAAGLQPGGIPLDLGARSTPILDTPYILTLLMGPVISPASTGLGLDPLAVLTAASRPVYNTGSITGFMLPGLVGQNLALDYSFDGPLAVRFREHLFGRLYGQYITPISGYAETRRLAFTYQVTSKYSAGWSINGLEQVRYQIQSFFSF